MRKLYQRLRNPVNETASGHTLPEVSAGYGRDRRRPAGLCTVSRVSFLAGERSGRLYGDVSAFSFFSFPARFGREHGECRRFSRNPVPSGFPPLVPARRFRDGSTHETTDHASSPDPHGNRKTHCPAACMAGPASGQQTARRRLAVPCKGRTGKRDAQRPHTHCSPNATTAALPDTFSPSAPYGR